jgi:predicted ATPase
MLALSYLASDLLHLGYPDQAFKRSQEAVTLARELGHPYSVAIGLCHASLFHRWRREPQVVQEYGEDLMRRSKERAFPMMQAWATYDLGWAQAQRGEVEEGIAQMRQGLDGWRSAGTENSISRLLLSLAERYGMAGEAEKGLSLLEEALDFVERTGERVWEAEVHRVKGELLQSSGRVSEAETCFRQAMEVARRQEAKSWELRATLSLGRLLQKEGRSAEARSLLSEIYGWFTEGFDTPDLQDARAMLEELGRT